MESVVLIDGTSMVTVQHSITQDWRSRLCEVVDITESGAIELSSQSAMQLAYLNSISWWDQLQTLYLSALDVSTERFKFDVQFYGGNTTSYRNRGPLNPSGQITQWGYGYKFTSTAIPCHSWPARCWIS